MLSDSHTITEIKNSRGLGKKDLNIELNNPCCVAIDVRRHPITSNLNMSDKNFSNL
jgi:hypothetical protein